MPTGPYSMHGMCVGGAYNAWLEKHTLMKVYSYMMKIIT
jgi:hypothetical protein